MGYPACDTQHLGGTIKKIEHENVFHLCCYVDICIHLIFFFYFKNDKRMKETYPTSHFTSFHVIDESNCFLTYSLIPDPPSLLTTPFPAKFSSLFRK